MTPQQTASAAPAPPPARPSALGRFAAPFRHTAYRRLALALILSTFASGVWAIALAWEVIRFGGSPGDLSIVAASSAVGVILPALLGGVVADRLPQKAILLVVAAVETLGMGVAAALSAANLTNVATLSVVCFCLGVGMAFYYPAYSAWLPALVPAEQLQAVNGFEGMVRPGLQQAIGPAVAGAAVAAAAPSAAMMIATAAMAIGGVCLLLVPLTPVRREQGSQEQGSQEQGSPRGDAAAGVEAPQEAAPMAATLREVRQDLAVGVRYLLRTPWLLATLLFAALMMLVMIGPMEVLMPFLVKEHLGGGPRDHSYVLAAFGVGGAFGSLCMGSRRMPRRYLTVMNLMWGLGCIPFVVIGATSHVAVVILCGLVMGAMFSAPMVIWGTLLQRRVPPHLLGRVASLDFFVSISLMPVSMALAGPLSHLIGLKETFLLAGVVPPLLAIVAIIVAKLPADELAHPLDVVVDDERLDEGLVEGLVPVDAVQRVGQMAGVSGDNHVMRP